MRTDRTLDSLHLSVISDVPSPTSLKGRGVLHLWFQINTSISPPILGTQEALLQAALRSDPNPPADSEPAGG